MHFLLSFRRQNETEVAEIVSFRRTDLASQRPTACLGNKCQSFVLNHRRLNPFLRKIAFLFFIFVDDLNGVSQSLVTNAKNNGSTDNITVVVVFFKPAEQILAEAETRLRDNVQVDREALFDGITSTSSFVGMNGSEHDLEAPPANNENPFASPIGVENGGGNNEEPQKSLFDSPSGGGVIFSDFNSPGVGGNPFDDQEQLKRASPSMFEQSLTSPAGSGSGTDIDKTRGGSENDAVDFMANQEHSWIQHAPAAAGLKSDSGFASSNNASASSEGSAENNEEDDEETEAREVSALLASGSLSEALSAGGSSAGSVVGAGGSGSGNASLQQLEDMMARDTPTPPIDEADGVDDNGEFINNEKEKIFAPLSRPTGSNSMHHHQVFIFFGPP